MPRSWTAALKELFPHALLGEPLSRHTTFRIGGPADAYLELKSFEELPALFGFAREAGVRAFMLGWGSNLLVRDGGIRGIVLRLRGEFEAVEFPGGRLVRAGAGARMPQLVVACAERGLAGSEPLVGIPGTVGGALVMNAGTLKGEIGPLTRKVLVFDPETLKESWLEREDLEFRYRRSNLEGRILLAAELGLKTGSKVVILKRVREFQKKRLETQPIHTYNVGSVFKNPPGNFAAKLIEDAGLKGSRCGGVKVSEMHANFIENDRGGKAADVLALVERIRGDIRARRGLELELEMKVVGEA